ncbi:hypothetical protein [Streptomyces virginiae]|uniref:hypothetical protein n=1 Tax=Streptomyces virginiae TaxID=1961 RepID=UPI002DBD2592|nr:hypothetical protein [Streptomyces sp. CMAA1738]MEC4571663.1 hypothetical protein [Streptomyces sp. CMAA1738]
MDKTYRAVGALVVGAFTGWLALGLWEWADGEQKRSCANDTAVCVTPYPLIGIGLWVVLAVLVLAVALPLLGVRPRKTVTVAAFSLQAYAIAILGSLAPRDVPATDAPNLIALALGPALVAVCTVPGWRRAGFVAAAVLVVAAFITLGVLDGF